MGRPSRLSKKLCRDAECSSGRRCQGQAGRDLVSGRSPHRPEERPRAAMGAARLAPAPARRPALRERLLFGAICPARATGAALAMPKNITLIFLPSRAPELNPVENIWQYLRQNWLSNRVFESHEAIVEAACEAWRSLLAEPTTITSIGHRGWAHVGQK